MPIELVTLDQERFKTTLEKAGVDRRVIDVLLELHDTQRATEKLLNELLPQMAQCIKALQLLNMGYKGQLERLQAVEKKFGDPNRDLVTPEKFDG